MDLDSTMFFRAENSTDNATKEILNTVYEALQEKATTRLTSLPDIFFPVIQPTLQVTTMLAA